MSALREKIPYEAVAEAESPEAVLDIDGGAGDESVAMQPGASDGDAAAAVAGVDPDVTAGPTTAESPSATATEDMAKSEDDETETAEESEADADGPPTLSDHIDAVIGTDSDSVRLLDSELTILTEGEATDVVSLVADCEPVPQTVVLDDTCSQKVLDVAAQRGVEVVIATGDGEYVKQPTSVQVRTV
jgi:hypothetical protein